MTAFLIDRGATWRRIFRFLNDDNNPEPGITTVSFKLLIPKQAAITIALLDLGSNRWELVIPNVQTRKIPRVGVTTYSFIVNGVAILTGPINSQGGNNSDGH